MMCPWCVQEMYRKNGMWHCKLCGHKEVDDRDWRKDEKEVTKNTN